MSLAIGPRATTEYGMGQELAALYMWEISQGREVEPSRTSEEIIAQLRADLAIQRAKTKRRKRAYRELENSCLAIQDRLKKERDEARVELKRTKEVFEALQRAVATRRELGLIDPEEACGLTAENERLRKALRKLSDALWGYYEPGESTKEAARLLVAWGDARLLLEELGDTGALEKPQATRAGQTFR